MRTKTARQAPTETPTAVGKERPPATNPERAFPPKGLHYEERSGKPSPFLARWREPGGKKRTRAFQSATLRDEFAQAWLKRRVNWGKAAPVVHPREVETWRTFRELTGGADPLAVARFWLRYRSQRGGTMTVGEAVERFMKIRENNSVARDTHSHLRLHLRRLVEHTGTTKLADVMPDTIRGWLASLTDPETEESLEPYTLRHHLRTVKLLFATAVREKWADDDPSLSVEPPKVEAGEIHVLSADDAERLFRANRDQLCIGRLALEAFGGLRYTSAARVVRSEILDAEKGIVLPGAKHKSGRRHYVDGFPDNLWQWIAHAPAACWDVPPRIYLDLKRQAFERAEVKNPGNVLRHSFCTFHVALHKDAARTAVLLTHRSPSMLYQHYKGRASEADGRRYFSIVP